MSRKGVLTTRNQILFGCVARNIETTGAALGLDKMGLNCPKVHRNLTYGEKCCKRGDS